MMTFISLLIKKSLYGEVCGLFFVLFAKKMRISPKEKKRNYTIFDILKKKKNKKIKK